MSLRALRADDAAAGQSTPAASGQGSGNSYRAQKIARLEEILDELNLTDAQKDQIKQIRASTTDRRERRRQICAILTTDQQAQLKQLWQQHRAVDSGSSNP